ncbi:Trypsin [Pseudobythopirellula maris]|uniref:Trypsin n=1 Tax=Pseudobythopirellula maris TaxID=2527991 RepID=A0A5C5ZN11_9BACT|nr:Trypsin [Pseudobythopirellula maris]
MRLNGPALNPFRLATLGIFVLLASASAIVPGEAWGVVTSDGDGTHVVAPGVPAFGLNLDGVVRVQSDFVGSGVLIDDTHILTAAHVFAGGIGFNHTSFIDATIQFDLPSGRVTVPVSGYANHPGYDLINSIDDLTVLELASPAPAAAPRYGLYTGADEIGKTVIAAGYGETGHGPTGGTHTDGAKRAGLNRYEATGEQLAALFHPIAPRTLAFDFDSGQAANDFSAQIGAADLGFGADEIGLGGGDSGGPSFIQDTLGEYRVAGVNVLIYHPPGTPSTDVDSPALTNGSWGEMAVSTRVSSYLPFINAAQGGDVTRIRRLDDGLSHVESGAGGKSVFRVENASGGAPTSLELAPGAVADSGRWTPGVEVSGSSLVQLTGGSVQGYTGVQLTGHGRLEVSAGSIISRPDPLPGINDRSFGVRASDDTTVDITGGDMSGDVSGLSAIDRAQVLITDGAFSGVVNGALSSGNAEVRIDGGSFTSDEDAFKAGGSSAVEVHGGLFDGAFGFLATDLADVEIFDGEFNGLDDGFDAGGESLSTIHGGSFTGDDFNGLFAFEQASVDIFGGEFFGAAADIEVIDSAFVRIIGSHFSQPLGLLTPESGMLSGRYFDGTPFEFSFSRSDMGAILLVPEPSSLAALVMAGACLIARGRKPSPRAG